jgi:hypothetical protein
MLRSYHANDRQVDSGVGVSYIKGKETKILILENGVFCRSIYLNSWKSRITHEQFFRRYVNLTLSYNFKVLHNIEEK